MAEHPAVSSYLYGGNAGYLAELYSQFLTKPETVDPSWQGFFASLAEDDRSILEELRGASWAPSTARIIGAEMDGDGAKAKAGKPAKPAAGPVAAAAPASAPAPVAAPSTGAVGGADGYFSGLGAEQVRTAVLDSIRALMLIRVYRVRGHLIANLDPLGLEKRSYHPELDPASFGFGAGDFDRPIYLNFSLGLERATLREIMAILHRTYCGHIGVEFMHIQEPDQKAWIQERIEGENKAPEFDAAARRAILERLTAAETFERFLQLKYTGTKRFGLEGGEAVIPAMEQIIRRGGELGLRSLVVGMAHRGRLNVLANFMNKPFAAIFSEFQGASSHPDDVQGSGDVKYHLGTASYRDFDGKVIRLSLAANPSHLEVVNPVVLGKVRAKQQRIKDEDRTRVMGLLLHGDSAFAGQGLVPETLLLSELKGYRTGGTIHFVINNQIGFTTTPQYQRSSPYPTDVAKGIQAPIFHVNGDDPDAVAYVARLAIEFRQKFHKDVVIDMVCYRRHGHNEGDEPAFTQPLMYRKIKIHPTTRELYAQRLIADKVLTEKEADDLCQGFFKRLEADYQAASSYKPNRADWLEGVWGGLETAGDQEDLVDQGVTGVDESVLREVGRALVRVPEGFDLNSKLVRLLKAKEQMFTSGEGFDWSTAEAMAFGTLAVEGARVRLSGQDCGRGTFSQRHAVLHDQSTEGRFVPLNAIRPGEQGEVEVLDSPLSEAAVLGFEYGISLSEPHSLIMWEAQFGDFANTAQAIIDQFIASAESKWLRLSGLAMLLPHGMEGQGPEHSSARPERYLQLCAENNLQVTNCSTPANFYHALRRQVRRKARKPLIVFTPKSLLRHKLCVSRLADFTIGTQFQRVIPEASGDLLPADQVRRVVLCTGKVYYDLWQEREHRGTRDVALVRVEQLYPFPFALVARELAKYQNVKDVVWCQEEPENQGYWTFLDRRIESVLKSVPLEPRRPTYVGRTAAAAPATGSYKRHNEEQATLVDLALTVS